MLRTIGERVLRELERKLSSPILKDDDAIFKIYLKAPTQERNTKDKIYSLHEPQVACIAKGKSGKAYAFGAKVAVVRGRKTGIITSVSGWRYNGPISRHWIQFEDEIKPNQTTNSSLARTCSPTIFMQI
jgi:IS5 family transposase